MSLLEASARAGFQVSLEVSCEFKRREGGIPVKSPRLEAVGVGGGARVVIAKASFQIAGLAHIKTRRMVL